MIFLGDRCTTKKTALSLLPRLLPEAPLSAAKTPTLTKFVLQLGLVSCYITTNLQKVTVFLLNFLTKAIHMKPGLHRNPIGYRQFCINIY